MEGERVGHGGMEQPLAMPELALVLPPLPLPPSVNHLYATVNGRRVLSRAGRNYKALVAEAVDNWQAATR